MEYADVYDYQPRCQFPGCDRPAIYKVAADWKFGKFSELRNYGTCCEDHRADMLRHAHESQARLKPAPGESFGAVGLYQLLPGFSDAELTRLPDEGL